MYYLSEIGLLLIVLGWVIQVVHSWKNGREIKPLFVGVYLLGVLLLVIDGFLGGLTSLAVINAVSFIAAAILLYLVTKK